MIRAVRYGESMRSVARRLHVSLCTVQRWVARGRGNRLDRADLADRPGGCPVGPRRTPAQLEDLVLTLSKVEGSTRDDLKANSDLGEYGAAVVYDHLVDAGPTRRVRQPAPPPGWYLDDLCARRVELDSFDAVEGLVIGKTHDAPAADVEVFPIRLRSGLASACTAAWSSRGRPRSSPPNSRPIASSSTAARSACRGTRSSTTTRSFRGRTAGPTRTAASPG